jgi:hypothetical protein
VLNLIAKPFIKEYEYPESSKRPIDFQAICNFLFMIADTHINKFIEIINSLFFMYNIENI